MCPEMAKKGVASNKINKLINRDQMGGTTIVVLGRICDVVREVGKDLTGLGQYSWIRLGDNGGSTQGISAYVPCKPGKLSKGRTVWDLAV
jgi:hypothetical protein